MGSVDLRVPHRARGANAALVSTLALRMGWNVVNGCGLCVVVHMPPLQRDAARCVGFRFLAELGNFGTLDFLLEANRRALRGCMHHFNRRSRGHR